MAECILMKSGGGTGSDECNAARADVLAGKTAVTKDSNDDPAAGTMPNKGAWTSRIGVNGKAVIPAGYHNGSGYVDQAITNRGAVSASLGINGTYTIPEGYHNGAGKVTQSIAAMGAQTVTPGNSQKVVSCSGKYMTGNVTVPAVSGLTAANIKKGVVVGGVTGTWEGYVVAPTDLYNNGAEGQWGIKTNCTKESNCIRLSAGYISTVSKFNWTGYRGAKFTFFSKNSGSSRKIQIFRGETTGMIGNTAIAESNAFSLAVNQWFTIDIPFSQNITDTMIFGIGKLEVDSSSYVTKISLY